MNKKTNSKRFIVVSILFYVAAVIEIFVFESRTMAIVLFCLGSAFLCLGAAERKKGEDMANMSKRR